MPQKYDKEIRRQCLFGKNSYREDNHKKLEELKKND